MIEDLEIPMYRTINECFRLIKEKDENTAISC